MSREQTCDYKRGEGSREEQIRAMALIGINFYI